LFCVTLTLLFEAQRRKRVQLLYWLPLVFLIWANIHIQFVYGLAAVGLLAGVNLIQTIAIRFRLHPRLLTAPSLPVVAPFVVLGSCFAAACAGPYSYHLYEQVFAYSQSKIIYRMIIELQALSFKYFNQYVELFLAIGAYLRWAGGKRSIPSNWHS